MTALPILAALATVAGASPISPLPEHDRVVERVASMVSDGRAQALASSHGLQLLNVLWEDTGRWQGSSVGPNISDVTIEVVSSDGRGRKLALMPVLRFPNFADRTADVRLDRIWLRAGNERKGGAEKVISLRDFLSDPGRYLSFPEDGRIKAGSLLAPRDTHALVSAQAAFLPVPRQGKATFHPVIFNYQSTARNPAVLTILVTRQGASVTVVDNARDTVSGGASWGQRLFFNAGGERAPLTAERISDVLERGTTMNGESAASLGDDANLLLLVQVPLRHREPPRRAYEAMAAPSCRARAQDGGEEAGGERSRGGGARPWRARRSLRRAGGARGRARSAVPRPRDGPVLPGDREWRDCRRGDGPPRTPRLEGVREGRLRRLARGPRARRCAPAHRVGRRVGRSLERGVVGLPGARRALVDARSAPRRRRHPLSDAALAGHSPSPRIR